MAKKTTSTQDVFIISFEAEINRLSRLMNSSSKAYWALKDRTTTYAKMLWACYLMNKEMMEKAYEVLGRYKYQRNDDFLPKESKDA